MKTNKKGSAFRWGKATGLVVMGVGLLSVAAASVNKKAAPPTVKAPVISSPVAAPISSGSGFSSAGYSASSTNPRAINNTATLAPNPQPSPSVTPARAVANTPAATVHRGPSPTFFGAAAAAGAAGSAGAQAAKPTPERKSPFDASGVVWPSSDPRGLTPQQRSFDLPECKTSFSTAASPAPLSSCMTWTAIGKGKALFGTQWLRAGDAFPWRAGVKVAAVCSQKVVLSNGESIGLGETLPEDPPAPGTTNPKRRPSC